MSTAPSRCNRGRGFLLADPELSTMLEVRLGILLHADEEYGIVLDELDQILATLEIDR